MQLRKNALVLAALAAVSITMMACGDEDTTGGGCTTDPECTGEGEICHPTVSVCVKTCESAVECPDTAKTCAEISATDARTICRCSTTALCNRDRETADLVCLEAERVCAPEGSGTGGGGVQPGATCSGTGQTTCAYGSYCESGNCAQAEVAPTCANFKSGSQGTWNPASDNGPVIYDFRQLSYGEDRNICGADAPIAVKVALRAYRTDADWPATRAGLSGFFYVTVNGVDVDVVPNLLLPGTGYNLNPSNKRDAEFQTYVCQESTSETISLGYFFTGGNRFCARASR